MEIARAISIGLLPTRFGITRRGALTRVSGLFFLVPPPAALETHVLFGEAITGSDLLGMAPAALWVALATAIPSGGERGIRSAEPPFASKRR